LKDAFTANVLKIFTNVDTILHIHFTDIHELKKENVYRKVLIFFLKRIHSVVVLSDKLRQDLVTLGLENKKLMVIRNYSILNFKKELSVKRVKRDILFIGSVDRRKGILDLFEAIHDFPEKLNWHLHIAGDFTSEAFKLLFFSKLKELNLTKRVTLHGYVSDEAKHKLFEMSSILVLPSYSEGMPLSILEGLSAGCAIVATNVGANKETIKSVTNLLQPGDLNAIKQELEKLLTDVQYLELRQKQSLELSKEFSFKKFVDQITPLYEVSTL
jgi:glycosyltransferase involved in cell wall biosynthesis